MKKLINVILSFICIVLLSGFFQDFEVTSSDECILRINKHKIGYSIYELDSPEGFLLSLTFIQDFNYVDGKFYWFEDAP